MKMNMNMNIIEYKINQHLNYNEHEVIYYQKSGDEETMALLESTDTKSPIFEINQIIDNSNRSYLTGSKC